MVDNPGCLDVNAYNEQGKTLLSCAAESGNLQIAEFLLQNGVDANFSNADGSKPLHLAAQYGRKEFVQLLLNRGIFVDSYDADHSTPLHYVAVTNDISSAGRENFQELVHILVDSHADINAVNRRGCTPLLIAAQNSCKQMVELFIKLGADLECCDENQWTVLHHACRNGWPGIVQTLVEGRFEIDLNARTSNRSTPAIVAAENSNKDILKLLIEYGADVNSKDDGGETVLHHVCRRGWLEVVKSIFSKGCDLNAKDNSGTTPLMRAVARSHSNIINFLVECGANMDCCNENGWTVLHDACLRGRFELVKSLVRMGSSLNSPDNWGETPLFKAAKVKHLLIVDYLLDCGADTECCDKGGRTVLHLACTSNWLEGVVSLTKKGSDVNAKTVDQNTPLHLAILYSKIDIIKSLLTAGADCNTVNILGKTPLNTYLQHHFDLPLITLFLRSGAYLPTDDYSIVSSNSLFKKNILQNTELCTVALINSYLADLSKIYKIPVVGRLPRIEKLKIISQNIEQDIAKSVKYEIQTKGYCDLLNVHPIVLSRLCVSTLVKHYNC